MAIKIIREPTTLFAMECERCECVFTYDIDDLHKDKDFDYIYCPRCNKKNMHYRKMEAPNEPTN